MSEPAPVVAGKKAARKRSLVEMALLTAAMFGFGFAFAPLYSALCDLTGLNGRSDGMLVASTVTAEPDLSRMVKVQFLTVVNGGREWQFRPEQSEIMVHPGEFTTVNFVAENMLDEDVVGQAVPAVTPGKAARHVKKTECFCFNQQPFKAREKKIMPVRLMLDPDLPKDLNTITLSYTFFDVTELAQEAAKPKG
ncbi:MAG: cytochrome c oxidase assembly protein [Pseudomonadota bacterium]